MRSSHHAMLALHTAVDHLRAIVAGLAGDDGRAAHAAELRAIDHALKIARAEIERADGGGNG